MPKWTRNELILTLDLYLSSGHKVLEPSRPEMQDLLALLNRIRANDDTLTDRSPRAGGSVKAKMANFRALDPTTPSSGWGNGGKLDLDVWNEFADDWASRSQEVARLHRGHS